MATNPLLKMQVGSLYASGDGSTFTGTGGPYGFSPFTSQFGGVISSAGLAVEPFSDTVYGVAAGDEVIFVIAVQNVAAGAAAYDVRIRATMPPGFTLPPEGTNLTVTDGTGTDLSISGDLFSANGIGITTPLAGYDANSGLNLVLITYTLLAGTALPATGDAVVETASVVHLAATPAGADISSVYPASGNTVVMTASPVPMVRAETDPSAVAAGQTVAFDVTVSVPSGTLQDLRLDTVLPAGADHLSLVSASILSVGASLTASSAIVTAGGGIQFGTVSNKGTSTAAGADTLVVRLVVQAVGTVSGTATLQTVLSAVDPNAASGRFSTTVNSSVGVVVPGPPPTIGGVLTAQRAASGSIVYPFGVLTLATTGTMPSGAAMTGTLAITLQDASLGKLVSPGSGSVDAAGTSFVATGTLATLQGLARQIAFMPGQAGTERFTVTLVDADGGTAQDASTTAVIAAAGTGITPSFAPALAAVSATLTAPADAQVYQGPVSYLPAGTIPVGSQGAAIVTEASLGLTPTFISQAAAILAAAPGTASSASNLLLGGTGTEAFFMTASSGVSVSETILGFHAGDTLTLFGFKVGTSKYSWVDGMGMTGYQGRTLQVDALGTGQAVTSVTFAGTDRTATDAYSTMTGLTGTTGYLRIGA